jgi:hypothetical protein
LPVNDVAIDVWIIRNQDVILTQHYQRDAGLNWQFPKFVEDLQTRFGQTIQIQKQNYNQILVIRNQQFSFQNFDSNDMYMVQNTTHLTHLATLFSQIIEQESSFLMELSTFQLMLQKADIISTTTKTIEKRDVIRTSTSFSTKHAVFSTNLPLKDPISAQNSEFQQVLSKMKRSLGDIFTPYSVTSIGDCETLWEMSNAVFNRRMWDCKIPGACKTDI